MNVIFKQEINDFILKHKNEWTEEFSTCDFKRLWLEEAGLFNSEITLRAISFNAQVETFVYEITILTEKYVLYMRRIFTQAGFVLTWDIEKEDA